jgi:hypothetical protein
MQVIYIVIDHDASSRLSTTTYLVICIGFIIMRDLRILDNLALVTLLVTGILVDVVH